jgi:hypothetical protein
MLASSIAFRLASDTMPASATTMTSVSQWTAMNESMVDRIFHALCAADRRVEILLVNARHVKNIPGRKDDALDAGWLS